MGRVANPALAALWRRRVERQQRSGLSILEFCRREGFSAGSFYAWKRRLRGASSTAEGRSRKQGPQRAAHRPSAQGGFVQFPLTVDSTIEVRFADDIIVSVPAEKLAVTLKTLQSLQREGAADA